MSINTSSPAWGMGPRTLEGVEVPLAMQELVLTGTLLPVGARLQVRHVFQVDGDSPVEVIYPFMLPREATLESFHISGEGFMVRSELQEVKQALKAYEAGIEAGRLSSLATQHADGLVNLSVGQMRPGEQVTVTLELLAGVELRDDGFRFRFPFTLAPSYHAQARAVEVAPGVGAMTLPPDVNDAVLPEWKTGSSGLHRIGFALQVMEMPTLSEVSSPSHPVRVRRLESGETVVELAVAGDVPNRDLVLDARVAEDSVVVLAGVDSRGCRRFSAVIPSTVFGQPEEEAARTLVFVLDRSGSMSGPCIQQARQALLACLGALGPQDRFGLIAFDNTVECFRQKLVAADDEHRREAKYFLSQIDARGGTELLGALEAAAKLLDKGSGEIYLITDGQVFGTGPMVQKLKQRGTVVHCLGIGSASQDRFFAALAESTGGTSRFVTPRERVDLAALEVFAAADHRLASEIKGVIQRGKVEVSRTVALAGHPLLVHGTCPPASATLELSWQSDGKRESTCIPLPLAAGGAAVGESLRLLEGSRRIARLETELGPEAAESAELSALSETYGLASRAMALVAVVERAGDVAGALPHTQVSPVGLPEDMLFGGVFEYQACMASTSTCHMIAEPMARHWLSTLAGVLPRKLRVAGSIMERNVEEQDHVLGLAARLEADGGLPGTTPGERACATLLAVAVIFCRGREDLLRRHLRRMKKFLREMDHGTLTAREGALLEAVLKVWAEAPETLAAWGVEVEEVARLRGEAGWRRLEALLAAV